MIAVDISSHICCDKCGRTMHCNTSFAPDVRHAQMECKSTDCSEFEVLYWLPLRTFELEPVSDAAVRL